MRSFSPGAVATIALWKSASMVGPADAPVDIINKRRSLRKRTGPRGRNWSETMSIATLYFITNQGLNLGGSRRISDPAPLI